jgi:hypothetical protein
MFTLESLTISKGGAFAVVDEIRKSTVLAYCLSFYSKHYYKCIIQKLEIKTFHLRLI